MNDSRQRWATVIVGSIVALGMVGVCSAISRVAPLDLLRWGEIVVGTASAGNHRLTLTQEATFDGYNTRLWVSLSPNECLRFGIDNDDDKWEGLQFVGDAGLIHIMRKKRYEGRVVEVVYNPETRMVHNFGSPKEIKRKVEKDVLHVEIVPSRYSGDPEKICPGESQS